MDKFLQLKIDEKLLNLFLDENDVNLFREKLGTKYFFDARGKMSVSKDINNKEKLSFYEITLKVLIKSFNLADNIPEEIKNQLEEIQTNLGGEPTTDLAIKLKTKSLFRSIYKLSELYKEYIKPQRDNSELSEKKDLSSNSSIQEENTPPAKINEENALDDLSYKIKNSGENTAENMKLAKQIFQRASNDKLLDKYITKDLVDELFEGNILVCKNDIDFFKEYFSRYLFSDSQENSENSKLYKIIAFKDEKTKFIKYFVDSKTHMQEEENIHFCSTEEEFTKKFEKTNNKGDPQTFAVLAFYDYDNSKDDIVFNSNSDILSIVHELVHRSSKIGHTSAGIEEPFYKLVKENSHIWDNFKSLKPSMLSKMESGLDEAFTEVITSLIVPEIPPSSGYDYGTSLIRRYCETYACDDTPRKNILSSYYDKNEKSLNSIAYDINTSIPFESDLWEKFCTAITAGERLLVKGSIGSIKYMLGKDKLTEIFNSLSKRNSQFYRYDKKKEEHTH